VDARPPERRSFERYVIWFPVTLRVADPSGGEPMTEEIGTICRDASSGGLLVSSPIQLKPETPVVCAFRLTIESHVDVSSAGVVLRVERNEGDMVLAFPYRLAISFDPARPDIEEMLRHAEKAFRESR
jgi:PilZ domain